MKSTLEEKERTTESSTASWNQEGKKRTYKTHRGIRAGRYLITVNDIVYGDEFKLEDAPKFSGLWYHLELRFQKQRKKGKAIGRRKFFKKHVKKNIDLFMERIMNRIIYQDGIYSFPGKRGFIFAAQYPENHPLFRYDKSTGTFDAWIFYYSFRKNYLIRVVALDKKWKQKLKDELYRGHKYIAYHEAVQKIIEYVRNRKFTEGSQ